MTLPKGVPVKLSVFLLACREVLSRLSKLDIATRHDRRITCESCIERFNYTLYEFFDNSSGQKIKQAAQLFSDSLHAKAGYIREHNKKAAKIFDEVVDGILENTSSFEYQSELEHFHAKGRDIAIKDFQSSPWINSEELAERTCYLHLEFGDFDENQRRFCITHTKQYHHLAPMAYYDHRWIQELKEDRPDVIVSRFTFRHNFQSYLAYLFWFIHEYTAHVYATDHRVNEVLNDGWLLRAAINCFKINEVFNDLEIHPDQISVFTGHLVHDLMGIPRRGYDIANKIANLPLNKPDQFNQITYELAAFQPQPGESLTWPTDFINALCNQYLVSRQRLVEKINTVDSIRDMLKVLSKV